MIRICQYSKHLTRFTLWGSLTKWDLWSIAWQLVWTKKKHEMQKKYLHYHKTTTEHPEVTNQYVKWKPYCFSTSNFIMLYHTMPHTPCTHTHMRARTYTPTTHAHTCMHVHTQTTKTHRWSKATHAHTHMHKHFYHVPLSLLGTIALIPSCLNQQKQATLLKLSTVYKHTSSEGLGAPPRCAPCLQVVKNYQP